MDSIHKVDSPTEKHLKVIKQYTDQSTPEKLLETISPYFVSVDNIFIDCTVKMPNDNFWKDNNIQPGCQYTAHDQFFKDAALKVLNLQGEYDSVQLVKTVGGCAMNTSRAANFYLNSIDQKWKNRIFSTGSIGQDIQAKSILEQLNQDGLTYDFHQDPEALTGTCAVTVVNVDRTCIAILDANKKYPTSHMEQLLQKSYMNDTHVFYSTAFFIASNYDALLMMAKFSHQNNKFFGFNFAAEFIYKYYRQQTFEMIAYADFIFCNKFEAIACSKYFHEDLGIEFSEDDTLENLIKIANGITNYEPADEAQRIQKNRPRIMIITNSGEPVVLSVGTFRDQPQHSFTRDAIDINKDNLLDSNSAGDSFVGGFFARLILIIEQAKESGVEKTSFTDNELKEAIHAGNLVACEVLQQYGCTFPTMDNFKAKIQENPYLQQ